MALLKHDQSRASAQPAGRVGAIGFSPDYYRAIFAGLKVQAVLGALSLLVLDLGETQRAFLIAFVCQWITVLVIRFRRPHNPTEFDLLFIRYGIIVVLLGIMAFGPLLLHAFGLDR
jgi:hypothetical protein